MSQQPAADCSTLCPVCASVLDVAATQNPDTGAWFFDPSSVIATHIASAHPEPTPQPGLFG